MEPDIYEAFSSFAHNDDQFELNFDDPSEQPTFEFDICSTTQIPANCCSCGRHP